MEDDIHKRVPDDTTQSELRSAHTPWAHIPSRPARPFTESIRCDVVIVGAGITGALLAERMTRDGHDVIIVERESAGRGSTYASTAMLLWEIDNPLSELTERYGLERAARAYLASFKAAQGLQNLVVQHGLSCQLRSRRSLYLAGGDGSQSLEAEAGLREKVGLPSTLLDHRMLLQTFGIARAGAILSSGSADVDPVMLTHALLDISLKRGAALFRDNAIAFDSSGNSAFVALDSGHEIEARHVVLATGYAMPGIVRPTIERVASSWAIATSPQPLNVWKEEALIWEDRKNYHYARTTVDGRIIFGGEDDTGIVEPDARDAAIPEKTQALVRELNALWPRAEAKIDYAWSGTFDSTLDGLPLVGRVSNAPNIFAAYGYGGNGITFSYLAAELIGMLVSGKSSPLIDDFAVDRTMNDTSA